MFGVRVSDVTSELFLCTWVPCVLFSCESDRERTPHTHKLSLSLSLSLALSLSLSLVVKEQAGCKYCSKVASTVASKDPLPSLFPVCVSV